jgi:hypothetical protein
MPKDTSPDMSKIKSIRSSVPETTIEMRIDLTERNLAECVEDRNILSDYVQHSNSVDSWQKWARKHKACVNYEKRLNNLRKQKYEQETETL